MLSNDPIYFRLEPYPPFKRDSYVVPQENAGVLQHARVGEGQVAAIQPESYTSDQVASSAIIQLRRVETNGS